MVPKSPEPVTEPTWQARAVDRSLSSVRARALARSSQFLAAALDLVEETGAMDFTVQSVVDRSQLSLRSFYQHFAGKEELMLALFEELVAQFVNDIEAEVVVHDDPFDQLEAFVRGYLARAALSRPVGGRTLTTYNVRLAIDRPADYARAIAPQLRLLASVVRLGVERGVFRSDLPVMTVTLLLNSALVSMAQMDVVDLSAPEPIGPDEVWIWCRSAVVPPPETVPPRRTSKAKKSR